MKTKNIKVNKKFIGREFEQSKLKKIATSNESAIIVMYGRRRVGKTELLEQTFRERNILKFEGIEKKSESEQMHLIMQQLADYTGDDFLTKIIINNWIDVFKYIHNYTKAGTWTIYFEELQWIANYKDNFVSELKYSWDNFFRHNSKLLIVLCGSSPSFMINQVMHSKALYNRSQYEFSLREFTIDEATKMLPKRSTREVMDSYLTVGGIPEYLKQLNKNSSMLISLSHASFEPNSFFMKEYERIFISSMADNTHYKKIIEFLAKKRFATRDEILKHLKISSSGYVSDILNDLETCNFIKRYVPYNLNENSMLSRYTIYDSYLQYYIKFIHPIKTKIQKGAYKSNPLSALNRETYQKWLGFAFERFCRNYDYIIAKILGFSAVSYKSGVYFSRSTNSENPGYQMDLIFDRDDHIITICELKYLQSKVTTRVINEFEKKLNLFQHDPNKTIQKVLITTVGADQALINRAYFDEIITLEKLTDPHYWQ